ncbi:hypothetical protein D9613_009656 [Agrocybe pediades]|uniref:C3H1-type domain-containing protein n=1 Tax=Agrocybe pediades TaxID=84607 RepID=A0A8H4QXZ7_9AGAR|nr:hypothetical protein D9613_009656 [Agrocybe pediades]
MPITKDQAAKTVCREHLKENTTPLRGSLRHNWYSQCEATSATRSTWSCKFSHTVINIERITRLGKQAEEFTVSLDYGYGFERYGSYEYCRSGWDVEVNGVKYRSGGSMMKVYNLPKSIMLAEGKLELPAYSPSSGKIQAICKFFDSDRGCNRDDCKFDHNVIDTKRFENLVRWGAQEISPDYEYLSVECRTTGGKPTWKITMKPDAFKKLTDSDEMAKKLPPRPFSRQNENMFTLLKEMEGVMGITSSA